MISTILFLLSLTHILALPQGAPKKSCRDMKPVHGGGIPPQADLSPYAVFTRRQNGKIVVTLKSDLGIPFEGYMLQARTPKRELLGTFEVTSNDSHTIDCAQLEDTVTHNAAVNKEEVEVIWQPPEDYEGDVIFNSTFTQNYQKFWIGVEAKPLRIRRNDDTEETIVPTSVKISSTTPPNFVKEPPSSRVESDPFYDGCTSTKLCFGAPANCVDSKNCKAVVAVTVRGDQYEFEMKAMINPGWVGVGLSDDSKMGDDSVIECVRDGNGPLRVYMSWTSGSPNYGAKREPNAQLGIKLLNSSAIDNSIYCKVVRDVRTTVHGKEFDLSKDKYFILVAADPKVTATSVGFHQFAYSSSNDKRALSDVSAVQAPSKLLIRLHGCFMLTAWIGTVSIGTLLARYYRLTWVNSSLCGKDIWFAWHRLFMVLTWTLTIAGFVLIFVELKKWSEEYNPHAILGTITTVLCFLQPIGAYFRPHPGTSKRAIFNWLHWFAGNAAHIIAIVTIFYSVKLTKAEIPDFMDFILGAYVAFHVVIHLILSIMGCISEKSSEKRVTAFPMKDIGSPGRNSAYSDRNSDAPYSGFRKFILGIYIIVIVAIVVALVVITALAPIEKSWNEFRGTVMGPDSKR